MGARRISEVGEDVLVNGLLTQVGPLPEAVLLGPGDDAAVVRIDGPVVVSSDTVVEELDFRRAWSSAHQVGVKVAAQNFADLAAMGAEPVALLAALTLPPDLPVRWAEELTAGLVEECTRAGAALVGGDVSGGRQVVVTGTVLGRLPGALVRRVGARPGAVVAVAGQLGRSAAGLALLGAGVEVGTPEQAALVEAHLAPRPPYVAGPAAARGGAQAMIDTSDGLLRDVARVARASGVRIDLDPQALAPSAALRAAAAAVLAAPPSTAPPSVAPPSAAAREDGTREDGTSAAAEELARRWVLTGGEDHALLAVFPAATPLPAGFRVIGQVLAGEGGPDEGAEVTVGGRPWTGSPGWTHFGGG